MSADISAILFVPGADWRGALLWEGLVCGASRPVASGDHLTALVLWWSNNAVDEGCDRLARVLSIASRRDRHIPVRWTFTEVMQLASEAGALLGTAVLLDPKGRELCPECRGLGSSGTVHACDSCGGGGLRHPVPLTEGRGRS